MDQLRGPGRAVVAVAFLVIGGALNVIYGIAGISRSSVFAQHAHYMFGNLKTWGWVTLILGILELIAAISLLRGGTFGRIFAILVGSLAAIGALLEIPSYPLLSVAIFALSLWIIRGLTREPDDSFWEIPRSSQSTIGHAPGPPPL
jgi:hypothetical protein